MGKTNKGEKDVAANAGEATEPQTNNVVSFLKPSEERLLRQGKLVSKPNKKTKKMRDRELLERQLRQVENEDAQTKEEAEDGLGQTTFDDLMQDLEGFTADSVVPGNEEEEEEDKAAERRRIRRNKKLRKRGYVSDTDSGDEADHEGSDQDETTEIAKTKKVKVEHEKEKEKEKEKPKMDFGAAMASILSKEDDGSDPILAKADKLKERQLAAQRREKKEAAEHRLAKALLQEKDHHVPEYTEASYERRLRKIATKGVVQLFNAVAQHQKQLQANTKAADEAKNETERKDVQDKESKTKESFFKKLKEAPKEEEEKKEKNLFSYSKGGWNAFNENYMLGAKPKDWNKQEEDDE